MTTNNLAAAAQKAVGVGNRLSSQRRSRFANGAPMSRSVGAPMRSATSRKPVRTVAMAPPRKAAPKKDVPMTPSHISARDGAGPHPLDSGGAGWDAVELYDLTGLTWSFTSPSSTEGRNIVKAACKRGGMALKGYSDWRKEDWAKMAAKAGVKFLDTFSTVAGMRGFRVCWAQHGVALMYVPGIRRFYTLADIAAGVADEKAERDAPEVVKVMENVGRVKKEFAEQFAIASDPALAAQAAVKANAPPAPPGSGDASPGAVGGADTAVQNNYAYPNPKSCVAKWCVGRGVDAASLYAEYGVGFDFHGPAGAVSRSLVNALAEVSGTPLPSDADTEWVKQDWLDAMENLQVSYVDSHAALTAVGRSWKVCWVEDAMDRECPAVMIWAPERNAYYTLGSLAAAGGDAPAPVEAAIRAVVAVAKSTPAPPGLKAALTRDCDFLTLLGRKPASANAPVSVGTTGGSASAEEADAAAEKSGRLILATAVSSGSAPTSAPGDSPPASSADPVPTGDSPVADPSGDSSGVSGDASGDFFRPAPELGDFDWEDSRDGLRRRPSRDTDDADTEASLAQWAKDEMGGDVYSAPGFEDIVGMEGLVPEGQQETVGQGEFFSRSAGYLSFVDGSWTKEDLAREMGLERDRDVPPETPRDFPDLSKMPRQSDGAADMTTVDYDDEDFKELIPRGLPKDFDTYHPMRMRGVDYLVAKTNDGRLDLREIMMARRRDDGHFIGDAERVDTREVMDLPPAFYHEVPWTERVVVKEEKHNRDGGPAEYDTRVANTVKVYLVYAEHPMDAAHTYDRRLDFTKPIVALDTDGVCVKLSVEGAASASSDGVLVIRDGTLAVEEPQNLTSWEHVANAWEVDKADTLREKGGQELHEDFLKEVEMDYVPDDTPEVDNF